MERGVFRRIKLALRGLGRRRRTTKQRYTDAGVLEVYLWAALNDRPVRWACDADSWPPGLRRGPLPDASTVSRRMRTPSMRSLRERLRDRLQGPRRPTTLAFVDAKPLPIGPNSHDRHSGFGHAAGVKARGYKLYAVIDDRARLLAYRIAPMQTHETEMARRMLREIDHRGYLVGDGAYDTNRLHAAARSRGVQLVAPRCRSRAGRPLGHRRHSEGRRRSIEMLEGPGEAFGRSLLRARSKIERFFGTLTATSGGLGPLPAWVRGWHRVDAWVAAKLTIHAARTEPPPA